MTNIGNINPYAYGTGVLLGAVGKLYLPVRPAAVIYTQLDNISGVVARKGETGISVNRIHILNTLISHVRAMRGGSVESVANFNAPLDENAASGEDLNLLIDTYRREIVNAQKNAPFLLNGLQVQSGELFAISA